MNEDLDAALERAHICHECGEKTKPWSWAWSPRWRSAIQKTVLVPVCYPKCGGSDGRE